jgi:hypothetical protein
VLYEETLALQKAKLGPDHPDTLASMNNLAHSYAALGRQADALKLREQTLALRKAKLGPDHPARIALLREHVHRSLFVAPIKTWPSPSSSIMSLFWRIPWQVFGRKFCCLCRILTPLALMWAPASIGFVLASTSSPQAEGPQAQ